MHDSAKDAQVQVAEDIFPHQAWELIANSRGDNDVIIVDVSTSQEYEDLHLEGAIHVNLFSRFFKSRLDIMDKNKTYLVYCKVGGRSKIAQKLMKHAGFQTVYNLVGGTLLWEEERLPFASGTEGKNKFSFCPFLISILAIKKTKRFLQRVSSRVWKKPFPEANHFNHGSGSVL